MSTPAAAKRNIDASTRDRALRLAGSLSACAADLPPADPEQAPADAWYEDIVAALLEGNGMVWHVSCPSRPDLRNALEVLCRRLDPAGDLIRVTSSPAMSRVDTLRRRIELSCAAATPGRATPGTLVGDRLYPASWLAHAALGTAPPALVQELTDSGIPLTSPGGVPTAAAQHASGFLTGATPGGTHVHLTDCAADEDHVRVYALLRSIDVVRRDQYHQLRCGPDAGSDQVVLARLIARLHAEIDRCLTGENRRQVDFSDMDPAWYLQYNYGRNVAPDRDSGILPEDEDLIRWLLRTLPPAHRRPDLRRVAIPGCGPFSYLGLLLACHLGDDGILDLTDVSPANVDFLRRWQAGALPADDAAVPAKFERFIVAEGGPSHHDCERRARARARIAVQSIFDLPAAAYDVVAESFVSCSLSSSRQRFWQAIRVKRLALAEPEPVEARTRPALIALHMLGARSWQQYPVVPLTIADVASAYADAGLDVQLHEVPAQGGRQSYAGMAAVVARPPL